jgi:hypothetical protein
MGDPLRRQAAPVRQDDSLALPARQLAQRRLDAGALDGALGGDRGALVGAGSSSRASALRRSVIRPAARDSRQRSTARERAITRR